MSPSQLIASLEGLRKRAKWLSVLYGLGLLILGAAGLIVLGAVADYLLRFPGVPRFIGLILATAVAVYVFWRFVWRPARSRPRRSQPRRSRFRRSRFRRSCARRRWRCHR